MLAQVPADDAGQVVTDAQGFVPVVGDVRGRDLQFVDRQPSSATTVRPGRWTRPLQPDSMTLLIAQVTPVDGAGTPV
jgi:hypothetical protein